MEKAVEKLFMACQLSLKTSLFVEKICFIDKLPTPYEHFFCAMISRPFIDISTQTEEEDLSIN